MAEPKTKQTTASVAAFLNGVADERQRRDAKALAALIRDATGTKPAMWGASIVGYGSYEYTYASGRTGTWMRVGFSPRARDLTVYLGCANDGNEDLFEQLGPHRRGKGCLYFKRLEDIDLEVLGALVADGYQRTV
jgi:hypothetical protein